MSKIWGSCRFVFFVKESLGVFPQFADPHVSMSCETGEPANTDEVYYAGEKKIHSLYRLYKGKVQP